MEGIAQSLSTARKEGVDKLKKAELEALLSSSNIRFQSNTRKSELVKLVEDKLSHLLDESSLSPSSGVARSNSKKKSQTLGENAVEPGNTTPKKSPGVSKQGVSVLTPSPKSTKKEPSSAKKPLIVEAMEKKKSPLKQKEKDLAMKAEKEMSQPSMTKSLIRFAAFGLLGILLVCIIQYARLEHELRSGSGNLDPQIKSHENELQVDVTQVARDLASIIQCQTVSTRPADVLVPEFEKLHQRLRESFPRVYNQLKVSQRPDFSIIYEWMSDDEAKKPVLLLAHIDVVEVTEETRKVWVEDCWSGNIRDDYLYGRGAIDNKHSVIGILTAVEMMLTLGKKPARTVIIAFGADEEIGGRNGAAKIVKEFEQRGIIFEMVLDEGGIVSSDVLGPSSSNKNIAAVGISEKGMATMRVAARTAGGHSAHPAPRTTIGLLGEALSVLERNQPTRRISPTFEKTLRGSSVILNPFKRFAIANIWLLEPLLIRSISSLPQLAASLRTTIVPTVVSGGTQVNVVPEVAYAFVNARIVPGESVDSTVEFMKTQLHKAGFGEEVTVEVATDYEVHDPAPISSTSSSAFSYLSNMIQFTFPNTYIVPYLVAGGTDCRYYHSVSDSAYRFNPQLLSKDEVSRMHSSNERISLANLERMVRFYLNLLVNLELL